MDYENALEHWCWLGVLAVVLLKEDRASFELLGQDEDVRNLYFFIASCRPR